MPMFRKKALLIRAEQFDGQRGVPGVYWEATLTAGASVFDGRPYVVTIHKQRCYLEPGDWVVPEPDGKHYYPIKDDVMRQNYDRIEEAAETTSQEPGCEAPGCIGHLRTGVSSEEIRAMRARCNTSLTPSQIVTSEGLIRLLDEIIAHRGLA